MRKFSPSIAFRYRYTILILLCHAVVRLCVYIRIPKQVLRFGVRVWLRSTVNRAYYPTYIVYNNNYVEFLCYINL